MTRFLSLIGPASLVLLLLGCSKGDSGIVGVDSKQQDEPDASADECSPGEERCECKSGDRCDDGLECRSGLCVEEEGSAGRGDDAGSEGNESDDDAEGSDDDAEGSDDDAERSDDDARGDDADDDAEPGEPEPSPDDDVEEPEPTAAGGADSVEPEPSGAGGMGAGGEPAAGGASPQGGAGGIPSEGGSAGQIAAGGSVATGDQLIVNGDFSSDGLYWNVEDANGYAVPYTIASGALCVTLHSSETFVAIGWPLDLAMAIPLENRGYELRYEAWTNDPTYLSFEAKVGEALYPYYPHFEAEIPLSATPAVYSHTFIADAALTPSGVVFLATWYYYYTSSAQVCIDNVELRAL